MSGPQQHLALVTIVVDDYDAAIRFYCDTLGFELVEDADREAGKRWVVVAPPGSGSNGSNGAHLLLARADGDTQRQRIGDQTGGRVFLFLHTNDFDRDYARYRARGVRFLETPREEPYGKVAVFEDVYGNRWDLLQPTAGSE